MPPFFNARLRYVDPDFAITSGSSFIVKSLKINDLYDPDPAVLSSGIAGFNQLMTFYEFYRVNRTSVEWTVSNNESFPVVVGFVFSQINLNTVILTRQQALDALENGFATDPISLQRREGGSSTTVFNRSILCRQLLGNPRLYEGDIAYTGTATTSPADQLWVNFITVAPPTATLANGVYGTIRLHFFARLFGRTYLHDASFSRAERITPENTSIESANSTSLGEESPCPDHTIDSVIRLLRTANLAHKT